ncbi:MAG: hypothetical protein L0H93_02490 [Nocardioides sp.]|nr:hypothetical protein [Nocardioides sp.]
MRTTANETAGHKKYDQVELVEVEYTYWRDSGFHNHGEDPRQKVLLEYATMGFGLATTVTFEPRPGEPPRLLDTFARVKRMH